MVSQDRIAHDEPMTDQTVGGQTTETPPRPPFTRPPRRLCRDPRHRRIGGVASGVATFFGLETTLVRVLFIVAAAVTGGTAIIAYLLAWALLPEPGAPETWLEARLREHDVVVLAVGAVLLLILFGAGDAAFGGGWGWGWHRLFTPLALIAAGIVLLLHLDRGHHRGGPTITEPPPPSGPSDPTTTIDPPLTSPFSSPVDEGGVAQPTPVPWWSAPPSPPLRPRADRARCYGTRRSGTACLFAATATLFSALDVLDVSARAVLAGMLIIVAAGILVSAWWGRRRGLLGVAFLLSIALAVASIPGLSLTGGVGDRVERPVTVAEVPKAYRLGVGDYEIDLTQLTLPKDRVLRLTAGLGAGRLTIDVPPATRVDLSGHVSAGAVRIDDRDVGLSGVDVDLHRQLPAASDAPRLDLHIDAAFADVEVRHVS